MHIEVTNKPSAEDDELVIENTRQYNFQYQDNEFELVSVYARDDDGRIVGGLTAKMFWSWLHVEYLWVDEQQRGRVGTQLMLAAEQEAAQKGCVGSMLNTFSFQAPQFYHKLGYRQFGELQGYQGEHRRHYLQKPLSKSES